MSGAVLERLSGITELFEAVLLYLPPKDLLIHVPLVCRRWREITNRSPALQKKLFFQPDHNEDRQLEHNPMLQELFPAFFRILEIPDGAFGNFSSEIDVYGQVWADKEQHCQVVLRPEASWRDMFLSQPPVRIEKVVQRSGCYCGGLGSELTEGWVRSKYQHLQEKGATMGLLWDITVALIESRADPAFFIEWAKQSPRPENYNEGDDPRGYDTKSTNSITIHHAHSTTCWAPAEGTTSGLKVADISRDIIEFHKVSNDRLLSIPGNGTEGVLESEVVDADVDVDGQNKPFYGNRV